MKRARRRRAVHVDVLLPDARTARRSPRRSSTCPKDRPVQLHGPVQGRPARLLGAGLPHEDRRGAGDRHRTTASRRRASARTRSSAPSCAASGHATMRQTAARVRPRGVRRVASAGSASRPAAARPAAAAGGGGAPDGKALFTGRRAAAAATRSPTPARPARPARTSTRSSRARTRRSSSSRSTTPTRRSPRASSPGSCPPTSARPLSPAQIDALVKYLSKVTERADDGDCEHRWLRLAAARPPPRCVRVPASASCFAAGLDVADPPRRTAGTTGRRQNAILIVVADRRAAVLPRRPRRLRLLVLLGGRASRRGPRTTPATARTRGRTTSASTPITR